MLAAPLVWLKVRAVLFFNIVPKSLKYFLRTLHRPLILSLVSICTITAVPHPRTFYCSTITVFVTIRPICPNNGAPYHQNLSNLFCNLPLIRAARVVSLAARVVTLLQQCHSLTDIQHHASRGIYWSVSFLDWPLSHFSCYPVIHLPSFGVCTSILAHASN